ncbi:MAG: class I SAM-dependent methyltransferase [Planctomycetota bacterium]
MQPTSTDLKNMKRVMAHTMGTVSPHWERMAESRHYTDVQRAGWRTVLEGIVGSEPLDVLDIGSGPGLFAQIWAEMGHRVTGIDYAPEMVERAQGRHDRLGLPSRFVLGEGEAPDLPDASFDVVTNRAVIHMLLEPGRALREWSRLLRPGGKLVTVNFAPGPFRPLKAIKSLVQYVQRGSKKMGIKLTKEEMRVMMQTRKALPFARTVPAQIHELFVAAGYEGVGFVSDAPIHEAQQDHEDPRVRGSGTQRYILIGAKPSA